jgi:hypothetical protein
MARLTLWYSVGNGGDGSAYPQFFENERLTEMDHDLMPEGWGKCCNGSIVIEGGDDMRVVSPHVITEDEFVKELDRQINSNGDYYNKRLARQFKNELRPEPIVRNIGPKDPYGEEKVEEKIKKYKDFK